MGIVHWDGESCRGGRRGGAPIGPFLVAEHSRALGPLKRLSEVPNI